MQQLQWLSGCMKDKRKWFWLAMALAVVSAGLCVVFPFITQQITDRVLVGQTLPDGSVQRQTQLLVPLVCVMIGAQLLRSCVRYGMTASLEYVSQNVQQDIRRHLYDNLCTQDAGFYTRYRTGDLMTRLTGDLDMVRHTVCWISYNAVESTCLFLFSMTYLFSVNAALTLLLLAVAPVILACSFLFSRTVYPLYASLREKLSRMNSVAQENIAGNKTVRAFAREAYENEKFENCNEEYRQANLKANFHWLKFFPYIEGCAQLMGLLSVLFGGLFIIQGKMTAGDLAAFSLMSWGLSEPMRALGTYLNDFQRFLTSAAKVIEIYFARTRIENPEHGRTEGECRGSVEFRGVTVAYPPQQRPHAEGRQLFRNAGADAGHTGRHRQRQNHAGGRRHAHAGCQRRHGAGGRRGRAPVGPSGAAAAHRHGDAARAALFRHRQQQHRVQRARRHLRRRRRPVRPPRGR